MKNYLIYLDPLNLSDKPGLEKDIGMLMLEFGLKATGDVRNNIQKIIAENGLSKDVEFFSKPGIVPIMFIRCSEKTAQFLDSIEIDRVLGIYELGMPLEVPGWEKHLKLVGP